MSSAASRLDPDPPSSGWSGLHRSVFAKLVVIMVAMAACLLLLVVGFFSFLLGPNLHSSVDQVLEAYTREIAARSPDFTTAKQLAARQNIQIRYEGPDGGWSTASDLPTIADIEQGRVARRSRILLQRTYFVAPAPKGGTYLFGWSLGARMNEAHSVLVTLLMGVMAAVIIIAYIVLKRLLMPLRVLNEGVARLSGGELDVALPIRTRDEFGRLTDAFNRMVGRVRAMVAARDQLLLDVSHELRSPLTRMKVALELSPPNKQSAGMVSDVAEMEKMIAELLELERLRSGRGLQIARWDLVGVLRDVTKPYQERRPGVRIVNPPPEAWLQIDGEKVRTVFRNLLENAAKYSPAESQPVEISIMTMGEQTIVRVNDDGPGIPEEDRDRLFEPFYRADRSRSKTTGGYGLGLSICKRVMLAHGGDIVLEPGATRGTTFVLTFPNRAPQAGA